MIEKPTFWLRRQETNHYNVMNGVLRKLDVWDMMPYCYIFLNVSNLLYCISQSFFSGSLFPLVLRSVTRHEVSVFKKVWEILCLIVLHCVHSCRTF